MIEFIIQSGKHLGKRLGLTNPVTVIGRESDCHIRLQSDDVSRRHCELRKTDAGVVVCDLGSRNGTFVNELQIESEVVLNPGDQLRVGPMILQVPGKAPAGGSAGTRAQTATVPVDETSDDEIASWLSDGEGDETSGSGDTTIIRQSTAPKTAPPNTPAPLAAPAPPKKVFKSIADEAADIIRRHRESLQNEE
jgi:predicted component of type VI protein secretion system